MIQNRSMLPRWSRASRLFARMTGLLQSHTYVALTRADGLWTLVVAYITILSDAAHIRSRFRGSPRWSNGASPIHCFRKPLDRESVRLHAALDIAPGDRRRDRKSCTGTWRVRADTGIPTAVSQIVDVYAACALLRIRRGRVLLGRGPRNAFGDPATILSRLIM